MTLARLLWSLGVCVAVIALMLAILTASALPLGYDSRAYWLAARHLVDGARMYALPDATLGQPDEFHYLPIVAVPFIALLPFGIQDAAVVYTVTQVMLAAVLGLVLIRPLPRAAQPWAAAGYFFFLPLVLEVTLGNVDLISVALALLAFRWRAHAWRGAITLAAAVGLKFMPAILLPFYIAAGRGAMVLRALLVGVAGLIVTAPFLWRQTLDYLELVPRYADTAWVRIHLERDEPKAIAGVGVPHHAGPWVGRQHPPELLAPERRAVGDADHARVQRVADADAPTVMHRYPRRARGRVHESVEDRPVGDDVAAIAHALGLAER